jgi:ferric-dicitrate binding protein FerR (iron transport regulator)
MNATQFDSKRITDYFRSGGDQEEETYVTRVFTDPAHEKELKKLLSGEFFSATEEGNTLSPDLEMVLHRIHYEINCRSQGSKSKRIPWYSWISGAAAAILIPLAVWWGIRADRQMRLSRETWVEISAPAWSRTQFSLPDGTTGWLNSQSKLKYKGDFLSNRTVSLTGEAYMDVAHDARNPFKVSTQELEIQVVGTRFNVASYDNEQVVEVVLEEGSLNLYVPEKGQSYRMVPNDRVTYEIASGKVERESVSPRKYVAWTEGKLVFRNDPIDVIARQLERWYNIEVELNIDHPENLRWRATFADEGLEEVLKLLKRSLNVDYQIEKREIGPDDTVARRKITLTNKSKKPIY